MKTLAEILDNTRLDEETGCMIWAGGLREGKYASIYAPDLRKGGKLSAQYGRKAVWQLANGVPLPNGWRAFGTCGTDACINPKHIKAQTCSQAGQVVKATGAWKNQVNRIAASRRTGRARSALTPELLELIRTSPETGLALQAKTGVGRTTISKVRTGKPTAFDPVGGFFTGLMR